VQICSRQWDAAPLDLHRKQVSFVRFVGVRPTMELRPAKAELEEIVFVVKLVEPVLVGSHSIHATLTGDTDGVAFKQEVFRDGIIPSGNAGELIGRHG
jgi:hypothetical protein